MGFTGIANAAAINERCRQPAFADCLEQGHVRPDPLPRSIDALQQDFVCTPPIEVFNKDFRLAKWQIALIAKRLDCPAIFDSDNADQPLPNHGKVLR
jgi:hypothetical protein